jgi:two-component system NtrC family sensor kinase
MGPGLKPGPMQASLSAARAPRRFARLPIRHKLLVLVLLPLLGVLPVLCAALLWWGSEALDRLLLTKVRSDLAVAQGYFERVLGEVGSSATGVAESAALLQALRPPSAPDAPVQPSVQDLLQRLAQRDRLDFIHLLPPDAALADRTSVEVLVPEAQGLLDPAQRGRVAVPLVPTRNAAPTARQVEDRAMLLLSTRAVRSPQGELLGHVQAGVLLNRNLPFIDHINEIVYPEGSLPFASRGTATLFLDDVRISTNVRLFGAEQDQRAIGTRVSQTVRETVLGRGTTWLGRAFVVNDWYVSAYQPLADGAGRRAGRTGGRGGQRRRDRPPRQPLGPLVVGDRTKHPPPGRQGGRAHPSAGSRAAAAGAQREAGHRGPADGQHRARGQQPHRSDPGQPGPGA